MWEVKSLVPLSCCMPGVCLLHLGEKLSLSRTKKKIVEVAAAFSCTAQPAETRQCTKKCKQRISANICVSSSIDDWLFHMASSSLSSLFYIHRLTALPWAGAGCEAFRLQQSCASCHWLITGTFIPYWTDQAALQHLIYFATSISRIWPIICLSP